MSYLHVSNFTKHTHAYAQTPKIQVFASHLFLLHILIANEIKIVFMQKENTTHLNAIFGYCSGRTTSAVIIYRLFIYSFDRFGRLVGFFLSFSFSFPAALLRNHHHQYRNIFILGSCSSFAYGHRNQSLITINFACVHIRK